MNVSERSSTGTQCNTMVGAAAGFLSEIRRRGHWKRVFAKKLFESPDPRFLVYFDFLAFFLLQFSLLLG